jgi:phosphatidylglycerol lysyltransferase
MRLQRPLVLLAALVTLGSGLVNLISLIGPSLAERMEILKDVFPVEFIHLSKFIILVSGFALIISAFNIYRRKRRAFIVVISLAAASVLFHLTKGLDYEEATVSLVLLLALVATRKEFTVKSSLLGSRPAWLRFCIALAVTLAYGTAGFWFIEEHDFHINFHTGEAFVETLKYLAFLGDPNLVPYTHYARFFIRSLYVLSGTFIFYSLFLIFRPAVYRYRARIKDRLVAKSIVEHYGRSAMDFFKYWPDKSYFFSDSGKSFIAYSVGRNFAVALADPVGPEEEMEAVIRDFCDFCRENDWRVGFHQTLPDFLPLYEKLGFRKLKLGDDAVTDLTQFSLEGRERKSLRHTVNKLEESGLRTVLFEPPLSPEVLAQLEEVSDEWLRLSRHRERRFTQGRFERDYLRDSPVFAARDDIGVILAFVNLIPSYRQGEATIDLMRRRHDAPNGIMDFVFVKLFMQLKEQGYTLFNLGMAPMAGFSENEIATSEEKAIHYFFQHMRFLFSYKGLHRYKAKYATIWEPRYAIYRHPLDLPRMALAIARVSEYRNRRDVKLTGFIHAARQSWPAEPNLDV